MSSLAVEPASASKMHQLSDDRTGKSIRNEFITYGESYHSLNCGIRPHDTSGNTYKDIYHDKDQNKLASKDQSLEFWRSHLRELQPCILPHLKHGITHSSSSATKSTKVNFNPTTITSHYFSGGGGSTLRSVFMAAWATVLRTYTGSDYPCFGCGTIDYDMPLGEADDTIRSHVDMLPYGVRVDKHTTPLDIVHELKSASIAVLPHRHISLAEIRDQLDVGKDALFNTCVVFCTAQSSSHDVLYSVSLGDTGSKNLLECDASIVVDSQEQCFLQYRDSFMSDEQASHMAAALGAAFASIVEQPRLPITQSEIFSNLDQQTISQWNERTPIVSESRLHDLIGRKCHSQPDAAAVVSWDGSLTYLELDRLSSILAHQLFEAGVGPDRFVPIYLDRSKWVPVAMLAVMKAGGAFCALDLSYPLSRLLEICQSLEATVILTTESNIQQANQLARTVLIAGDNLWTPFNQNDQELPTPLSNVCPNNALYAVFTSGSTGKPKGIVVEHRSFSSCALASLAPLNIGPQERIFHFASYAFDLSIFEILTALTAGASVAIPSEEARLKNLPGIATELQATWAFLTPTVARLYRPEEFPSLRTLCLGGEAVTAQDIGTWMTKNLITGYNPAECCPLGISGRVDQSAANFLGWSFSSQCAWVVDPEDYQKLVPVGAVGELVIEGPAVARGYIHDPLSALPDSPFILPPHWLSRFRAGSAQPTRLYRTGDLVQYGHNGAIHFMGRKDLQVKIRGQRMELAEIEFHLQTYLCSVAHKVVVDAVTLGDRLSLAAFILPIEYHDSTTNDIQFVGVKNTSKGFQAKMNNLALDLRNILPSYMVPTVYLPISHIPFTRSGKIDRSRLKSLALSLPPEALNNSGGELERGEAPTTDMERLLQSAFAQVLDYTPSRIWADSNFFHLGGDSIHAMRLLAVVHEKGLYDLTFQHIFQRPVLKDMALMLNSVTEPLSSSPNSPGPAPFSLIEDAKLLTEIACEECGVAKEDIQDIYPCTPLQESLIVATAYDKDAYVALQSFTLQRDTDQSRLKAAWNIVADNYDILRTRILHTDKGFYQVLVRGPMSFSDGTDSDLTTQFQPYIGLGTPLIQLCSSKDRLLVAMHHAVYDGWSLPLLLAEVGQAYDNLSIPKGPSFSRFVKHCLDSIDSAAPYWRAELQDVDPVQFPQLPSLNYKPVPESSITRSIPLGSVRDDHHGATIATKLQFAWAITSQTYANSNDTIFGVISSGRTATVRGVDKIIGPTLASMPLRVSIDPDQEVTEALEELQYQSIENTKYEHIGMKRIAQQSSNAATACRFQTLLVVEPNRPFQSRGTWYTQHEFLSDLTKFSDLLLTLRCQLLPDSVEITAIFDSSVVPGPQMQRILCQFEHILTQVHDVGSKAIKVGDINRLNSQDWNEIKTWNATLPPITQLCVHQVIQEICQRQPEAPAIHSWDGDLTYHELCQQAEQLAGHLQALGIGPNKFVAIYFEKSLWTVVTQIAVLLAGAAFMTLEASQPIDRLREICRTVKSAAILTSKDLKESANKLEVLGPLLVVDREYFCQNPSIPLDQLPKQPKVIPSDAMYSIATSGTTGKPKVVAIEHAAFLTTAKRLVDLYNLTESSRVFQFAGYSFDAMILEHFLALLAGGCICIPSLSDRDNRLTAIMNDMRVDFAILTSSTISLLTPAAVPTIRTLVQGGEPMHQGIIDNWAPHVRLFNAYGPAECSACSCSAGVFSTDTRNPKNIGFAISGVCWIVDPDVPDNSPVAIGAEGELIIEGASLGRGYIDDPARTAVAFMPRPRWLSSLRGSDGEDRVYRTGDIVRYDPDGSISYVRRKDSQVKLRGQRLELQEVEHHVQNCFPDAIQTVVDIVTLPNTPSTVLVALVLTTYTLSEQVLADTSSHEARQNHTRYLLPIKDPRFSIAESTAESLLQEKVPSYMIPSVFLPISRIPQDANGKVNRREIARLLASLSQEDWHSYNSVDKLAPTTELERELQTIWARVLDISPDSIGINDSFFRLGGDSVTCMQVAAHCNTAGIPITVKAIFKERTIQRLVAGVTAVQRDESHRSEAITAPEGSTSWYTSDRFDEYMTRIKNNIGENQVVEDVYPCSSIQRGILIGYARNPSYYEEAIQWKVASNIPIDIDRLRAAWYRVVERHAVLRTVFMDVYRENYLDQVVLKNYVPSFVVYSGEEEMVKPDTSGHSQPMHRLQVEISNTGEVSIRLHINHALVDGHSLFLIKRDLALAYENRLLSSPAPSPYRDYLAYVQKSTSQHDSKGYWKSYLKGAAPCHFPSLNDSDSENSSQPFGEFTLSLGETAKLTQFCEKHKLALSSVLHVAWAIVVQRYTAADEVCFGYMTSGRHVPIAGTSDIVGPLFNMLVARVNLDFDGTVLSVMQQYQDSFVSSLDHQHQSLAETMHSIGSVSGKLFNTMMSIFNNMREYESVSSPSSISLVGSDIQARSEYPITLNILMLAEQTHMMFCYHTSLLSDTYARTIAKTFSHVLSKILENPQLCLNAINILDEEDRHKIYERNRAIIPSDGNFIHYIVHQHSLESPNSPAVQAWDGEFSYKQLDELSSLLADQLIEQGVGVNSFVPILLEKTCWTPVAMIAVLKSGASFVLTSAAHPVQRLQTIYSAIDPAAIIASPQTLSKALALSPRVIQVTGRHFEQDKTEQKHSWQSVKIEGSNVAYTMFTSGTTGKPKGAIIEHSCIATSLRCMQSRMFMNSSSRVLQFSSHDWDVAVIETLLTLRAGGCICIPSDEERIGNLAQAANRMKVSWAVLTPTVAQLVRPEDFTHLETLVVGGEALSPADLATWHDKVRLIQSYGPAECSITSTVSEPLTLSSDPRTIGQPCGCVAWVVHRDNHHLLAPFGAVGELVVEGPTVGRGYLNNPDATAAVFIEPPSWLSEFRQGDVSTRLYKTGDLVRCTQDGTLIFVGRKDNQVKIRGQRVEIGEVEFLTSRAFPGSHVVVEVIKSAESMLVAAFILDKDLEHAPQNSNGNLLRPSSSLFLESVGAAVSSLRETMPSYMIPTIFLPLAYLPKAPTGKTDRRLLRDHAASLSQAELDSYRTVNNTRRTPSSSMEARLQEYVGGVLHKPSDSIPLDEDLFTIGLDSLKAMTLATSVREHGLMISVPTIFQYPRLSELAVVLSQEKETKQEQRPTEQLNPLLASLDELCAKWQLERNKVTNVVPTTYYQRGFIASHHATFLTFHFSLPFSATAFRTAFMGVVRKHDIFRIAFVPFRETFVQMPLSDFDVPVHEISTEEDDPSLITESVCREADKSPASFGTPCTQLYLIVGRTSGRLSVVLKLLRAQYDGVTVARLIEDLRSAFDEGASPTLPSLDYPSFITSRVAHNTPSVFRVWQELLEGSSMTYLAPREEYHRNVDRSQIELRVMSTRDIPMPNANSGFTMATMVKAAWALCLAQKAGTKDVVFAQVVRNRHLAISGIDRAVGPCINLAPVRVPLKSGWVAKDLLEFIQRQQMRTMDSDTADWDDVVRQSTIWPHDTDPGSAVHYLSAPVGSKYVFAGDNPCHFQQYDFKMTEIYPMMLCLPFPSELDPEVTNLKIVFTSAVFNQQQANEILDLFVTVVTELANNAETLALDSILS
ncbi:lysergyl peptide synthetase 1 [Daldinia bambusicola]|nr:lysergyl peptide synthetase 1 [Daldinia bambusicola]